MKILMNAATLLRSWKRAALLHAGIVGLMSSVAIAQTIDIPRALESVAYRNAPFVIHETFNSASPVLPTDHMVRVDLDGSDFGPGQYAAAVNGTVDRTATVYYSAAETGYSSDRGYYFLGYYWYHTMDNGADFNYAGSHHVNGHEHDMEGVFLIVKKSPYYPYGQVIDALSQSHGELVPWINGHQQLVDRNNGAVGSQFQGFIEYWNDLRYNSGRPVAAVRGRNHGSHFAQNCDPALPQLDGGFGMWKGTEGGGTYTACIHSGYQWILYRPVMDGAQYPSSGLPGPDVLDPNMRSGTATYQLIEVRKSPIWADRNIPNQLFAGAQLFGPNGFSGYSAYHSLVNPGEANPMWQWQGGYACQTFVGMNFCWYSFGVDGTGSFNYTAHWPVSPSYGRLLTAPADEAGMRFTFLPELSEPMRYNPYRDFPPNYYTPPPLSVGISGPSYVGQGTNTWTAVPSNGVAPFTYQWSGLVSGTGASVSSAINGSGDILLDVWDAAGHHASVSLYVTYSGCPAGQITC